MNIKRKLLFILPVLIIAVTVFLLLPSDEKKIRNNLAALAEYSSSLTDDTAIASLRKTAMAAELCQDPSAVTIESAGINRDFDRKELINHILMMKRKLPDTRFSFHDTVVKFPSDNRAEIITTLQLQGKVKNERFRDAYKLSIEAEKIESDWLFSSFKAVEFREK